MTIPLNDFGPAAFGPTGIVISPNQGTADHLARAIELCLSNGVKTFDLADIYGGRRVTRLFGEALNLVEANREELKIVTKAGVRSKGPDFPENETKHYDSKPAYLRQSLEQSLEILGLDQVDLFMIHRPDYLADTDETAAALDAIQSDGLANQIGVSNFSVSQIDDLSARLPTPLAASQISLSLLDLDPIERFEPAALATRNIRLMAWSPLARGALFKSPQSEPVARLAAVASSLGMQMDELAVAFLCALPGRPMPVLGTSDSKRLMRQVAAAKDGRLNNPQWYEILEAARGYPVR